MPLWCFLECLAMDRVASYLPGDRDGCQSKDAGGPDVPSQYSSLWAFFLLIIFRKADALRDEQGIDSHGTC